MTIPVYEFPQDWYKFARAKYRLQSRSQSSARPWIGGKSIYGPHAQVWIAELTMIEVFDQMKQEIGAFFSRLDGQAGLLRMSDPTRLRPWYDRAIAGTSEIFSDGTRFSDGTAFQSGFLPPAATVAVVGNRGDRYLTLAGLPVSLAAAFTRGDLIQICPNGIPGNIPHLYEVQVGGATDVTGKIGMEIRPGLRTAVAVGDGVSLRYASTVFRCVDDDQGVIETTAPFIGNTGFSLIEALDQVP